MSFFTANPALALESGIYVYEKKNVWADIDHRPSTIDHRPSDIGRRTTTRPIFKGVDQSEAAHYIIMSAHIIKLPSLPQEGGGGEANPRGEWRSNSIGGGEVPHPPWRGELPGDLPPGDPPGGSPGGGPQSGDLFFRCFLCVFVVFSLIFYPWG